MEISTNQGGEIGKNILWHSAENATVDDAVRLLKNNQFNQGTEDVLNLGYAEKSYWVYIQLINKDANKQQFLWSFYRCGIAVSIYNVEQSNQYELIHQSSMFEAQSFRPYPIRVLSFPIELESGEERGFLAHIQLVNINNMRVPMDVKTEINWLKDEIAFTGQIMRYLGLFAFVALFNLVLFLMFKSPLYFWQSLHVFSLLVFNINEFFMEVYVIPESLFTLWAYIPRTVWALLATLAMIQVFRQFTNLKNVAPSLNKIMRLLVLCLGVSTLFLITVNYIVPLIWDVDLQANVIVLSRKIPGIFMFAALFLLFTTPFFLFKKVEFKVKIYFISLFVMLFGGAFYMLNYIGLTNFTLYYPGNILVGHTFEILGFTFILLFSFFEERNEKILLLKKQVDLKNKMTQEIILAEEKERKRIAQDLHDAVVGRLGALRFYVNSKIHVFDKKSISNETLLTLENIQTELEQSIQEARAISHNLIPKDFTVVNLKELLSEQLSLISQDKQMEIHFVMNGEISLLSQLIQVSIYRIISELVNNILKHAQATHASIRCEFIEDNVTLIVEDNGIGFDMNQIQNGIGFQSVKSRVAILNGDLNMESSSKGTKITIFIPFES